ncbi:Sec-independent protein translocase protein TatB [Nakamurella alba]|uniref:Sec-independent protein translocase protein TatB n=1 Tax=Nakamurella alba TaxID=2665158 RepID=UPI0018AC560B|nr:Sec-independent protein translocase protein TatB [Nakamurella alba]
MFGLSWGQILLIVLVGVFLLGPERIPTAVQWVTSSIKKVRTMAQGAQAQLRSEIGPELDELRRQIADLQSLKELQELRALRDLNPRNLLGKSILGDEFSGGVTGFLGLDKDKLTGSGVAPSLDADPVKDAAADASANGAAPQSVPATPPPVDFAKPAAEAAPQAPAPAPVVRTGPIPFDDDAT